jgi:hypothetical protein
MHLLDLEEQIPLTFDMNSGRNDGGDEEISTES